MRELRISGVKGRHGILSLRKLRKEVPIDNKLIRGNKGFNLDHMPADSGIVYCKHGDKRPVCSVD